MRAHRLFSVFAGLSAIFLCSTAGAKDPAPVRTNEQPIVPDIRTFDAPNQMAEQIPGFVFKGDTYYAEFIPEGLIWRFTDQEEQFAYWIVEMHGSKGQVLWTESKGSSSFGSDGDQVAYQRTLLIREAYEGGANTVRQVWEFSENPLWEGGDLVIISEILTGLEMRKERESIAFFDPDTDERIGPFLEIVARDRDGREITLEPSIEEKTVTITIPAGWLYQIGAIGATP